MVYDYEIGAFLSEPSPPSVLRIAKWIKDMELKLEQENNFKQMCNNEDPSAIIAALRCNGWNFQQRDDSYLEFRKGNSFALFGYRFLNKKGYLTLLMLIDKSEK